MAAISFFQGSISSFSSTIQYTHFKLISTFISTLASFTASHAVDIHGVGGDVVLGAVVAVAGVHEAGELRGPVPAGVHDLHRVVVAVVGVVARLLLPPESAVGAVALLRTGAVVAAVCSTVARMLLLLHLPPRAVDAVAVPCRCRSGLLAAAVDAVGVAASDGQVAVEVHTLQTRAETQGHHISNLVLILGHVKSMD